MSAVYMIDGKPYTICTCDVMTPTCPRGIRRSAQTCGYGQCFVPATGVMVVAALETGAGLQQRVASWMEACFGAAIAGNTTERNHRFLEEALELVQACGCTYDEAHLLVDYVFGRPVGEPHQEVGGVILTLAALCLANGLDMDKAGEDELARVWTKIDAIRAKQAAKPKSSPLPQ